MARLLFLFLPSMMVLSQSAYGDDSWSSGVKLKDSAYAPMRVGDVIYWSPGPDVAMNYRHDGQSIPSLGIVVMGKMDSSVEGLKGPGSVRVTI